MQKRKFDVAIIGLAGRFPGAKNINELLLGLRNGFDSVGKITTKRIKDTALLLKEKYLTCGYLEDIDKFDYELFNIPYKEAVLMSPQQKQLLEVVYECIENAGYNYKELNNSNTAVYTCRSESDYINRDATESEMIKTGKADSFLAAKISNFYKLKGPAVSIETACSSGLAALYLACNDLLLNNVEQALVGGANIYSVPLSKYHTELKVYSPDGKSRAFSDKANGMSRGEMVISLLLKPLKRAISNKDNIKAVIKSVAINNNAGRSASPTAPDSILQSEVIKTAWTRAGINPLDIGYIEAHGSGTKLGDGLEIEGLNRAFAHYTKRKKICPISTIKSNIGHGMSVAGLAGIVRAVLSIQEGEIFPTVNYSRPSRLIDFSNSSVYVNRNLKKWKRRGGKPRLAAVTSIGVSGINGHAVIEEAPRINKCDHHSRISIPCHIFKKSRCWSDENIIKKFNRSYKRINTNSNSDTKKKHKATKEEIIAFVCSVWRDIFKLKSINFTDNFFKLGGHSLLATQILNRLNDSFSVNLSFNDIFNSPTPDKLSDCVLKNIEKSLNRIIPESSFIDKVKIKSVCVLDKPVEGPLLVAQDGVRVKSLKDVRERIIEVCRTVLRKKSINVNSDFFVQGGDSLSVVKAAQLINKIFNIELDFEDIYDYSNVRILSKFIWGKLKNK